MIPAPVCGSTEAVRIAPREIVPDRELDLRGMTETETTVDGEGALVEVRRELRALATPEDAAVLQRFFKTGPGEYGEGDQFLGIRVPQLRALAKRQRGIPRDGRLHLLRSPWHEERLLALLLMVDAFGRGSAAERERLYTDYLAHTRFINNWDLVDTSAEHIVGAFLGPEGTETLLSLAGSGSLWERRIAILATFHFIKRREFAPTLRVAERLLRDPHDLIHKAVGWMLREVGKRDAAAEEAFLRDTYRAMPRTMVRYAIERFPEPLRKRYLAGEV
jgi:3-methyladenine DNA glycosylase AlkD